MLAGLKTISGFMGPLGLGTLPFSASGVVAPSLGTTAFISSGARGPWYANGSGGNASWLREIEDLAREPAQARKEVEAREFARLREAWVNAGGRLVAPRVEQETLTRDAIVVSGGARCVSPLWGTIDLARLNRGLEAYRGVLGYIEYVRDVALATNRFELSAPKLYVRLATLAGCKPMDLLRKMEWKCAPLDWRRTLYFSRIMAEKTWAQRYHGAAGYDRFALDYVQGDSQKAHQIAGYLLSEEQFAALRWGQQKRCNVSEQESLRQTLLSGKYRGEAGYDAFALEYFEGNSLSAYVNASSLLSKESFRALEWGKQKRTNVREQALLREELRRGGYQGEEGYNTFALTYHDGNSAVAYHVASSLLDAASFARLAWGPQKQTNVCDEARTRERLMSGNYRGEEGYARFASEECRGDPHKAYQVARSLIGDEAFSALQWGKLKKTKVRDQAVRREELLSGMYCGVKGYDRFAVTYCKGNSQRAYHEASALLPPSAFAALGWGRQKTTNVHEQEDLRRTLLEGSYTGARGYDRFALEYTTGDSNKAHQLVLALLGDEVFALLRWGNRKITNVRAQETIRETLLSKGYTGVGGYERFALERTDGDMDKAYMAAVALLSDEAFESLAWGKRQYVNVRKQALFREQLASGRYQGRAGYDAFAQAWYAGESQRAYQAVSSLVSEEEFHRLQWGPCKFTYVHEQGALEEALKSGRYEGCDGRVRFVIEHFDLLHANTVEAAYRKAFAIASSLLSSEPQTLEALHWVSTDAVLPDEVKTMRDTLLAKARDASDGSGQE